MKPTVLSLFALASATGLCSAASTVVAHFGMGEQELAGTGLGNTPTVLINSTSGVNMAIGSGSTAPIVATPAPTVGGSTHAMDLSADGTYFTVADNLIHLHDAFLVEGWAMAANADNGATIGTVFSYGHGGGGIPVAQHGTTWSTFVGGVGWSGAGAPLTQGVWTHLAVL